MPLSFVNVDFDDSLHREHFLQLMDVYARDPMGGGLPLSDEIQSRLLAQLARRPQWYSIMVYDGQQPVALANCQEGFSTFAARPLLNIHDIVVDPLARGQGIAGRLLSRIELLARKLDCCKVTLEVLEGNLPARRTYEKSGFAAYCLDPRMGKALYWEKKLP
jgi:GNAT superfamily N-acetyltransferase